MGFDELVDQAGGGGEADAMPLAASGEAQGDRQMGLAGAGGAQGENGSCQCRWGPKDYVLLGLDVVALSQLQNGLAVQGRDGRELKFIEGLENGEACLDDAFAF